MKTRKINVIKGFTVPPGYSLRITQQDGEVLEKRAGEQSGGQYSFEQIASGINPDWELIQESGGEVYEIPEAKQDPQEVKPPEKQQPLRMDPNSFVEGREYREHLDEEVAELLDGIGVDFRVEILKQHESNLREITREAILEHPRFEELGGYTSRDQVMTEMYDALASFSPAFKRKLGISTDSLSTAGFNAALSFYNGSNRLRELYDNDVHKFLDFCVGSATDGRWGIFKQEVPKTDGSWFSRMPKAGERFTTDSMREFIAELQDPEEARDFFATCRMRLPESEKIRELTAQIEELDVKLKTAKGRDFIDTAKARMKLNSQKKDLVYGPYISPFREAIVGGFDISPYLAGGKTRDEVHTGTGLVNEEELKGIEFTFAFVNEDIKPRKGFVEIRRTPSNQDDGRSFANAHSINMSKKIKPQHMAPIGAHEAGHVVEYSSYSVLPFNSLVFLASRLGQGEKTVSLREHYNDRGYKPHEAAFLDEFPEKDAYIGRLYCGMIDKQYSPEDESRVNKEHTVEEYAVIPEEGSDTYGIIASEILSMGMQKLYSDPGAFAITQPELFRLVWSLRTQPALIADRVKAE